MLSVSCTLWSVLLTADWKALAKASPLLERELPNLAHLAQAAAPVTVTTQPQAATGSLTGTPWVLIALLIAGGLCALLFFRRAGR